MNKILTTVVVLLLFTASSCQFLGGQRIYGDGHITTQDRNIGSFNSVDVGGNFKVHVRQDATPSVKIEADQNLMQYIDVYINGNTLRIEPKHGYNLDASKDIIAYVSAPVFKSIGASGACDIVGENTISGNEELSLSVSGSGDITMDVNVPKLNTDISGNGTASIKGQAADFSATVSGSGDVKCIDLVTDNTKLDLSGSSDAEVTANKKLDVEISGSAHVKYKGNASVSQDVSGSGKVEKVG